MGWKTLLEREVETVYAVTNAMLDLVDDGELGWKPETGSNWMTTGQVLKHIETSCGACFKGFVTGDWGMPEGMKIEDIAPEDMLPPAEKMQTTGSVAETKAALAADKKVAVDTLAGLTEEDLTTRPAPAPWDKSAMILGHRLLHMVDHLALHKAQLYYYLKLQGKSVNTDTLWGL